MRRSKEAGAAPALEAPEAEAPGKRLAAMKRIGDSVKSFQQATEVLTSVRAHPTRFPLYDLATRCGGHPIERISLVHGPSNHGKSQFVHGLGLSFLQAGNFYVYVDAEFTTPAEWLRQLMGRFADHPGFLAQRPKSYEDTVDSVREFVTKLSLAREKGDIDDDVTGLIVIDSIRKLVPRNLLAKMLKDGGIDGANGRGAMMKAAINAQWMDELVPLLYHTKTSMVFIAREYDAGQDLAKMSEPGGGHEFKVGGGKSLIFESSLVMRITRSWVRDGTGETARIIGERHNIAITKTKVSGKQGRASLGAFHTSNGLLIPEGFDRARDVLEFAEKVGLIQKSGSWLSAVCIGGKWQGTNQAVVALSQDEEKLDALEDYARAEMKKTGAEPDEEDTNDD